MIVAKAIKSKYDFYQPYVQKVGEIVNQTLLVFCGKRNLAYTWRYKSLESLSEKIETGRYESWDSLEDLFAATIIIPHVEHEKEVISFLDKVFEKKELKKRGSTLKPPDVFRFDATRGIYNLRSSGAEERSEIYKINFEIQIRTAFEHAWSVATHSLGYKTDKIDWQKLRLVSQLKSSVEQLDMLVSGSKQIHKHIMKYKWPEVETKMKLLGFIKSKIEENKIPDELAPKDFSRLCENILSLIKHIPVYEPKKTAALLKKVLEAFNCEIDSYNESTFPRSVSLFQLFLGVMVKYKLLYPEMGGFSPLVTSELEALYPEVREFPTKFIY